MSNETKFLNSPDWSTAPEWARWFAVDSDGSGFYFEERPDINEHNEWYSFSGLLKYSGQFGIKAWQNSLQQRPKQ